MSGIRSDEIPLMVSPGYGLFGLLSEGRNGYHLTLWGDTWWPSQFAIEALRRMFEHTRVSLRRETRKETKIYAWEIALDVWCESFEPGLWRLERWLTSCERLPVPAPLPLPPFASYVPDRRAYATGRDEQMPPPQHHASPLEAQLT